MTDQEKQCVMDFPQAWEFVRETYLSEHDSRCSYRTTNGGMLCDCFILNNEYERRKAERLPQPVAAPQREKDGRKD